ncbi:MAG: alpha/beta hydrolase [bacterium]
MKNRRLKARIRCYTFAAAALCALSFPWRAAPRAEDAPAAHQPPAAPAAESAWYAYDSKTPLDAAVTDEKDGEGFKVIGFSFVNLEGERVPGVMTLPAGGGHAPPFPVVVMMHGYMQDKANFIFAGLYEPFSERGIATVAIDLPSHGGREGNLVEDFNDLDRAEATFRRAVFDVFRTFDFVETREELDATRIGYFGISMGAIVGAIACGADERVKTAVFTLGGGGLDCLFKGIKLGGTAKIKEIAAANPGLLEEKLGYFDPLEFVSRLAPRPVLFYNVEDDQVVPRECAEKFHAAAGEPKKVVWQKSGGHLFFPNQIKPHAMEWYEKHLIAPAEAGE